jgi:hypothetical protein
MFQQVLDGFDKTRGNATKAVSTILRQAYSAISSKGKSRKDGSQNQSKKSRGGESHKLDTIQEHEAALILYDYKIVSIMEKVMSLPLAVNRC